MPESEHRQEEIDRAIDGIKALATRTGRIMLEELLSAKHDGRRH